MSETYSLAGVSAPLLRLISRVALGLALFLVSILAPTPTTAATEAEAVALVKKIDELYRSRSSQSTMTMEIVTPNWQRTLALEAWTRGMDDTFIRVLSPKKDRGVATLKLDREMWNYFPIISTIEP